MPSWAKDSRDEEVGAGTWGRPPGSPGSDLCARRPLGLPVAAHPEPAPPAPGQVGHGPAPSLRSPASPSPGLTPRSRPPPPGSLPRRPRCRPRAPARPGRAVSPPGPASPVVGARRRRGAPGTRPAWLSMRLRGYHTRGATSRAARTEVRRARPCGLTAPAALRRLSPRAFRSDRDFGLGCPRTQAGSRVSSGLFRADVGAEPRPGAGARAQPRGPRGSGVRASAPHSRRPRLRTGPHRAPCAPGSRSPRGRWASAWGRAPPMDRSHSAAPDAPPWLQRRRFPQRPGSPRSYPEALPLRQPRLPGRAGCCRDQGDRRSAPEASRFLWRHLAVRRRPRGRSASPRGVRWTPEEVFLLLV